MCITSYHNISVCLITNVKSGPLPQASSSDSCFSEVNIFLLLADTSFFYYLNKKGFSFFCSPLLLYFALINYFLVEHLNSL